MEEEACYPNVAKKWTQIKTKKDHFRPTSVHNSHTFYSQLITIITGIGSYTSSIVNNSKLLIAVMWMWIRSDPHSFGSVDPDPEV